MLAFFANILSRDEEVKPVVKPVEKPKLRVAHRCTVEMLSEEMDRDPSHDMLHEHDLDDLDGSRDKLEFHDGLMLDENEDAPLPSPRSGPHDLLFSPRSDMSMIRAHSIDRVNPNDPHASIHHWLDSLNTGRTIVFLPAFEVTTVIPSSFMF
jgi:hypothetical protein